MLACSAAESTMSNPVFCCLPWKKRLPPLMLLGAPALLTGCFLGRDYCGICRVMLLSRPGETRSLPVFLTLCPSFSSRNISVFSRERLEIPIYHYHCMKVFHRNVFSVCNSYSCSVQRRPEHSI